MLNSNLMCFEDKINRVINNINLTNSKLKPDQIELTFFKNKNLSSYYCVRFTHEMALKRLSQLRDCHNIRAVSVQDSDYLLGKIQINLEGLAKEVLSLKRGSNQKI